MTKLAIAVLAVIGFGFGQSIIGSSEAEAGPKRCCLTGTKPCYEACNKDERVLQVQLDRRQVMIVRRDTN